MHCVPRIASSPQTTGSGRESLKARKRPEKEKASSATKIRKEPPAEAPEGRCIIAIRLRGQANLSGDVIATLNMLHMSRKYSAVLVYEKPDTLGMLRKVKDYITWGEAEKKTLGMLLEKRCRPEGARKLTPEHLKERLQIPSIEKLAEAIERKEIPLSKLREAGIRLVFHLHPPRGGFKGPSKRSFGDGGELGYRGTEIARLVSQMI